MPQQLGPTRDVTLKIVRVPPEVKNELKPLETTGPQRSESVVFLVCLTNLCPDGSVLVERLRRLHRGTGVY